MRMHSVEGASTGSPREILQLGYKVGLQLFSSHCPARCFDMNMSKSRDIQAKMPSPKVIYASNESKSVLARNLEECRDNDKNSQSVFLSFKCILARNCEGTEQLQKVLF